MPLIRMNVSPRTGQAELHGSPQSLPDLLRRVAAGTGPVIIMIHGYKYQPLSRRHCPHDLIFHADHGWPAQLDLATDDSLGICFGWAARGSLAAMFTTAGQMGRSLAQVIETVHRFAPNRAIHLIAHSMGAEVALSALALVPAGAVRRVILITGASFQSVAARAMRSPAGRQAEIFNITTRENDLFDCLFEQLIRTRQPGDRALGQGIAGPRVMNIELDCPRTLDALGGLGWQIAPSARRICHWSGYSRAGAMAFYADLLKRPHLTPMARLAAVLPPEPSPRWSRLPLAGLAKRGIMTPTTA